MHEEEILQRKPLAYPTTGNAAKQRNQPDLLPDAGHKLSELFSCEGLGAKVPDMVLQQEAVETVMLPPLARG